jgi:serine/threonine protein phosphatase 1
MTSTDSRRIYAIGDVHGCIDHLRRVQAAILADLREYPHPDPLILFVGDYTDRGPDSRGTIDHLMSMQKSGPPNLCLFGNHDLCFLEYLADPLARSAGLHWLHPRMGGELTLASYGISGADLNHPEKSHSAFVRAVPPEHAEWLAALPLTMRIGDYLFVHAGIRPGIAIDQQELMDLIWIREGFLDDDRDHGFTVIHGHTVVPHVSRFSNRIDIDTGAVFGGTLSCLILEDGHQGLLEGGQRRPLPR